MLQVDGDTGYHSVTLPDGRARAGCGPEQYLADMFIRVNDHPAAALHELLPYQW